VKYFAQRDKRFAQILSLQMDNDMVDMLLAGKPRKEIIGYICDKYGIALSHIGHCLAKAQKIIRERKRYEIQDLVSTHIDRYEYIYSRLHELGAFSIAVDALKGKEILMGFHRSGFHMKVTKGEIQQVTQAHVFNEYDFNKLDDEKRIRMRELIDKASQLIKNLPGNGRNRNKTIDGGADKEV